MRVAPRTAGSVSAAVFLFLIIFGVGWPGPGAWLLVLGLLITATAAGAWWLDGALVSGGVIATGRGSDSPFGRPAARAVRAARRAGDSLLLTLGLPGPDARGRWVLPDSVHVALIAGTAGVLALIIFIGGALGGGGGGQTEQVPVVQANPALDFSRPIVTASSEAERTSSATASPLGAASTLAAEDSEPIVVATPTTTRPAPARPLEVVETPADPGRTVVHEVVSGDTVYDLAIHYGTTIEAIMDANGLGQYDTIDVGDRLIIPLPEVGGESEE